MRASPIFTVMILTCLMAPRASVAQSPESDLTLQPTSAPTPAPAPEPWPTPPPEPGKALFVLEGGVWYIPSTVWDGKTTASQEGGGNLNYSINNSPATTYEGGLINAQTSLSLGVSVDVDNNFVGKLNRLMGYIGYRGFFVRVQNTTLKGTANWKGPTLVGQPLSYEISSTYQNVELIRMFDADNDMFWGIGYSTLTLPQQISVWGDINRVYTNYDNVDPASKIKIYSLLFGLDTLNWKSIAKSSGFGFWCFTQDLFGYGTQSVDPGVDQRIKAFYGGRTIPSSLDTSLIDYTLTIGAKWERRFTKAGLGIGFGANFHGMWFMSGWNARGSGANELNAYSTTMLAGYGPQIKLIGTW